MRTLTGLQCFRLGSCFTIYADEAQGCFSVYRHDLPENVHNCVLLVRSLGFRVGVEDRRVSGKSPSFLSRLFH